MIFNLFGGGMLTGIEIKKQIKKGNILIDPYDENCVNPNGYNLKLHPEMMIYERNDIDRNNFIEAGYRKFKDPSKNISSPLYIPDEYEKSDYINGYASMIKENNMAVKSVYDVLKDDINDINDSLDTNLIFRNSIVGEPLDMRSENKIIKFTIPESGYILQPGVLYIGRTVERTSMSKFIPMINGRSSGGRLGLSIHICAGFGDIGFDGTWTLEITVVEPLIIYPNEEVAQVCYFKPYGRYKDLLYNGRYNNQIDATASRFYEG